MQCTWITGVYNVTIYTGLMDHQSQKESSFYFNELFFPCRLLQVNIHVIRRQWFSMDNSCCWELRQVHSKQLLTSLRYLHHITDSVVKVQFILRQEAQKDRSRFQCCVFFSRLLTLTGPLFIQVGVTLQWTRIPSKGSSRFILTVFICKWAKAWRRGNDVIFFNKLLIFIGELRHMVERTLQ